MGVMLADGYLRSLHADQVADGSTSLAFEPWSKLYVKWRELTDQEVCTAEDMREIRSLETRLGI